MPRHRLIRVVASLAVVAGCVSGWSDLRAQPKAATAGGPLTQQDILAGMTMHAPDAFYDPPAPLPARPGALLRSEPLNKDVTLPAGTHGWRILYTTTVDDFTPATAVATVFAPSDPHPSPLSLIAWEHGTTGLLQKCMPSLASEPTTGIPALGRIIAAGWVIVATDYSFAEKGGPLPYLIGEGEARAVLDAVRAARQMPELSLDAQAAVWGYSQGGHAALWTDINAPMLIAQGLADTVVVPHATDAYVDERCTAGQRLEYWTFAGLGHTEIVQPEAPLDGPLIAWTTARFASEPPPSGCSRRSF